MPSFPLPLRLNGPVEGDPSAAIISVQGEAIVLRSPRAFAPGTPFSGLLVDTQHELRVKATRSKREDRGDNLAFTVEGRILDLTRTLRTILHDAPPER